MENNDVGTKDYGIMNFVNETVSPVGETVKQKRVESQRQDIKNFKEWCLARGLSAGHGKVLTSYVRGTAK